MTTLLSENGAGSETTTQTPPSSLPLLSKMEQHFESQNDSPSCIIENESPNGVEKSFSEESPKQSEEYPPQEEDKSVFSETGVQVYQESLKHLRTQVKYSNVDLRKRLKFDPATVTTKLEQSQKKSTSISSLFKCCTCFGSKIGSNEPQQPLDDNMIEELVQLLCITQIEYDVKDSVHRRMLFMTNFELTEKKIIDPKGNHWLDIGFLGDDPSTEFRGIGMLGALQILYFVSHYSILAKTMYSLSLDKQKGFPFCIATMHMALMALQGMKEGLFNNLCNKYQNVLQVLNLVFVAITREFLRTWKAGNYTENDFHTVLHHQMKDRFRKQSSRWIQQSLKEEQKEAKKQKKRSGLKKSSSSSMNGSTKLKKGNSSINKKRE